MAARSEVELDSGRRMILDPVDYGGDLHVAVKALLALRVRCSQRSPAEFLPDTDAARAALDRLNEIVSKSPFGF